MRPGNGFFLRTESSFNVATEIERLDDEPGGGPPIGPAYGPRPLHEVSHGLGVAGGTVPRPVGDGVGADGGAGDATGGGVETGCGCADRAARPNVSSVATTSIASRTAATAASASREVPPSGARGADQLGEDTVLQTTQRRPLQVRVLENAPGAVQRRLHACTTQPVGPTSHTGVVGQLFVLGHLARREAR